MGSLGDALRDRYVLGKEKVVLGEEKSVLGSKKVKYLGLSLNAITSTILEWREYMISS